MIQKEEIGKVIAAIKFLSIGIYDGRFSIDEHSEESILIACYSLLESISSVQDENVELKKKLHDMQFLLSKKDQDILDANSKYANALNGLKL